MTKCLIIISLCYFWNPCTAQESEQQYLDRMSDTYIKSIKVFNEGVKFWETRGGYKEAMVKFIEFGELVQPLLKIDPTISPVLYRQYSYEIKDIVRRYIRFMFNCHNKNPTLCKANNGMTLAWNMMEDIKSLIFRHDLINSLYEKQDKTRQQQLKSLFVRLTKATDKTEVESIENAIIQILPEYHTLSQAPMSIQTIKKNLKSQEVFLSFLVTDNRRPVYVWKITASKDTLIELKINSADLFFRIENVKASFEKDTDYQVLIDTMLRREIAQELADKMKSNVPYLKLENKRSANLKIFYDYVVKPLNLHKGQQLIMATDQNISSLPFDMLVNSNGHYFFEDFSIKYVPSGKVFSYLRQHKGANASSFDSYIGFGSSNHGSNHIANTEIKAVSALFSNATPILDAKEQTIYKMLHEKPYDIIHFSTHAVVEPYEDPNILLNSMPILMKQTILKYDGSSTYDGKVSANEIISKIQKLEKTNLVFLSGCETAPSADIKQYFERIYPTQKGGGCVCSYGETFSNLTSAFFAKGVKKVLATQWAVDPEEGNRFVQQFFSILKETKKVDAALKETKTRLMDAKSNTWASFIIIGD